MIRQQADGGLSVYVPKKDLEEAVVAVEWDDQGWGGTFQLEGGLRLRVGPLADVPRLPVTLDARRLSVSGA